MGLFDFFKKSKATAVYSHADYNKIIYNSIVDNVPIEKVEIGNLSLPSGHIVVCDPLASPDMPPLSRRVQPGKYPVTLFVAKTQDSGDRVAIAVLSFINQKANKFELAVRPDEDITKLGEENDFFGFPVDAGLGAFMDLAVLEYYKNFLQEFYLQNPNGNIYDDFFSDEFKKNPTAGRSEGDWIHFNFPNKSEYNLTMFSSGHGDGVYPAYWGITNQGDIVNLIIDFHVLLLPDE